MHPGTRVGTSGKKGHRAGKQWLSGEREGTGAASLHVGPAMGASGSQAGLPRPELGGGLPTPGNPCQMQGLGPHPGAPRPLDSLGHRGSWSLPDDGNQQKQPKHSHGGGRGGRPHTTTGTAEAGGHTQPRGPAEAGGHTQQRGAGRGSPAAHRPQQLPPFVCDSSRSRLLPS